MVGSFDDAICMAAQSKHADCVVWGCWDGGPGYCAFGILSGGTEWDILSGADRHWICAPGRARQGPADEVADIGVGIGGVIAQPRFRQERLCGFGKDVFGKAELVAAAGWVAKKPHDRAVRREKGADQYRAIENGSWHACRARR